MATKFETKLAITRFL